MMQTLENNSSLLTNLRAISPFYTTRRFYDITQKLEDSIKTQTPLQYSHPDEYCRLIIEIASLSLDLDTEELAIYEHIRENYIPDFQHPQTLVMTSLSEEILKTVSLVCDRAMAIASASEKALDFAEFNSGRVAPNLSSFAGAIVAMRLIASAGGMQELSVMSAQSVLSLGTKNSGSCCYVENSRILGRVSVRWRSKVRDLVAEKVIVLAKVDLLREEPRGAKGRELAAEVRRVVERWEEEEKLTAAMERMKRSRDAEEFVVVKKCRRMSMAEDASLTLAFERVGIGDA